MLNLFSISNAFNGFSVFFLMFIGLVSLVSGIFIIITKNPIVSVLHLILLFSSIACYLIFIGINFIGLSYLLVYVGAVSILFLFILMLINIRVSELTSDTNNNIPLGILTILAFYIPFSNILPDNKTGLSEMFLAKESTKTNFNLDDIFFNLQEQKKQISYVSSSNWDNNLMNVSDISSIGNVMYTSHSIWLIITSIILLLAMVGSIVITIKQKY